MSEHKRRLRGARLVAAIGEYLEREQTDARSGVLEVMLTDRALPLVAAHSLLTMA